MKIKKTFINMKLLLRRGQLKSLLLCGGIVQFLLTFVYLTSCAKLPESRSELVTQSEIPSKQLLAPFRSDGCSFWPEGTKDNPDKWLKCCILHDLAYWRGGSEKQKIEADEQLRLCVKDLGHEDIASMMEQGASLGGIPQFQTSFRWGYGWNFNRGYLILTAKEQKMAEKLSPKRGQNLSSFVDQDQIDPKITNLPVILY